MGDRMFGPASPKKQPSENEKLSEAFATLCRERGAQNLAGDKVTVQHGIYGFTDEIEKAEITPTDITLIFKNLYEPPYWQISLIRTNVSKFGTMWKLHKKGDDKQECLVYFYYSEKLVLELHQVD